MTPEGARRGFNLGVGLTEPVATVTLWHCLVNTACAILTVFTATHFVSCTIQCEETGYPPRCLKRPLALSVVHIASHKFDALMWLICVSFCCRGFCSCDTWRQNLPPSSAWCHSFGSGMSSQAFRNNAVGHGRVKNQQPSLPLFTKITNIYFHVFQFCNKLSTIISINENETCFLSPLTPQTRPTNII